MGECLQQKHPACTIHEDGIWLPPWLGVFFCLFGFFFNTVMRKNLAQNGEPKRYSWEHRKRRLQCPVSAQNGVTLRKTRLCWPVLHLSPQGCTQNGSVEQGHFEPLRIDPSLLPFSFSFCLRSRSSSTSQRFCPGKLLKISLYYKAVPVSCGGFFSNYFKMSEEDRL